jgi:hypothetical protein
MSFGLCNAPASFQRCMMVIFSDLVFMDDFSIYSRTFEDCLANLDKVLKQCQMANLVLNWEKCHFMIREGIVLGHKVSEKGIMVDKAKIEVIEQLPPPTNVKGIHNSGTCRILSKIHSEFLSDCSTPHSSSSQRCRIRLHGRVPSIIPHDSFRISLRLLDPSRIF